MAVPVPSLREFLSDADEPTIWILTAVEEVRSRMNMGDIDESLLHFCSWYCVAAIHDRDRLTAASKMLMRMAPWSQTIDAVISVMSYDAYLSEQFPSAEHEVHKLREIVRRHPDIHRAPTTSRPRQIYCDMISNPRETRWPARRNIHLSFKTLEKAFSGEQVVRTDGIFPAIFHASAECLVREKREDAFGTETGPRVREDLRKYILNNGDWSFTPVSDPEVVLRSTRDALWVFANRLREDSASFIPYTELHRGNVANYGGHRPYALLQRTSNLIPHYLSARKIPS